MHVGMCALCVHCKEGVVTLPEQAWKNFWGVDHLGPYCRLREFFVHLLEALSG